MNYEPAEAQRYIMDYVPMEGGVQNDALLALATLQRDRDDLRTQYRKMSEEWNEMQRRLLGEIATLERERDEARATEANFVKIVRAMTTDNANLRTEVTRLSAALEKAEIERDDLRQGWQLQTAEFAGTIKSLHVDSGNEPLATTENAGPKASAGGEDAPSGSPARASDQGTTSDEGGDEPPLDLDQEIGQLRDALWREWEYNHAEHCSRDWPHPIGKVCKWPLPHLLGGGETAC